VSGLIGQYMGRYHILEKLGESGMATVYKAYDSRLEREVAVKVILPGQQQTPKFLKRFEREAKAMAQLSHPNIIKILDYGEQDGSDNIKWNPLAKSDGPIWGRLRRGWGRSFHTDPLWSHNY
jgi:serine/threonine protein kinase